MTIGFPLLLIPLAIYNIVVFLMPGVSFTAAIATLRLPSGAEWPMTFGDLLLAVGLLLLLFEVIKAAKPGAKYLTDHLLSLLVFCGALAEFSLLQSFGTSTFFLLTVMMAVDFLAGAASALRHRKYRAISDAPADHDDLPQNEATGRPVAESPTNDWDRDVSQMETVRREPRLVLPPEPSAPPPPPPAVPPVEKISPAVHESSGADLARRGRKISEWSVADLMHDADHPDDQASQPAAKPPSAD